MIRLVSYFLLIAAGAWGLSWVADRPGSLTVEWLGYDIQTSVFIAAVVLILSLTTIFLLGWFGVLTWTAPKRFAQRVKQRRERVGQDAVRRGIFAAGAGDKVAAAKAGAIAKKNVPEEPLALLLEAQSAQLNEDAIASRQAFERMLDKPEMAELGLRGLFVEANKAGQAEAAKQFAERALAANPALSWPSSTLFEIYCREGDWRAALRMLGIAKQHTHLSRGEAHRRRALLLTQLAIELEDTEQSKALAHAQEALQLVPSLTPAAAVAGRLLAAQGNSARATKLLTEAWRTSQHPDIALIYAHARSGDSPRDRLARVKALVASAPATLEGDIAVAVAAIEAKDWAAARTALDPHLSSTPPARVCRLMARIEAGQGRDSGRVREWLAKATRGAPDPVWVAPDGTVSAEWQAVSPVSGGLGVFEWKTPPINAADDAEDLIAEILLDIQPANTEPVPAAPAPAATSAAQLPPPEAGLAPGGNKAEPDRKEPKPAEAAVIAASIREIPAEAAGKQRTEKPKPNIFTPGPAPDDPGPRSRDNEDIGTPLTRFRQPDRKSG
jgi:HemY protein